MSAGRLGGLGLVAGFLLLSASFRAVLATPRVFARDAASLYRTTQFVGYQDLALHEAFGPLPAGTRRFALVGGSDARGAGCDYRYSSYGMTDFRDRCSIASALRRLIDEPGTKPARVFNLAVDGSGLRTLALMCLRALDARPRGLLVFLEPGSIVSGGDFTTAPAMNGELLQRLRELRAAGIAAEAIPGIVERLSREPVEAGLPADRLTPLQRSAGTLAAGLWRVVRGAGGPDPLRVFSTPEYFRRTRPDEYEAPAESSAGGKWLEDAFEANRGFEIVRLIGGAAEARGARLLVVIPWSRSAPSIGGAYQALRRELRRAGVDFVDLSRAPLEPASLSYDHAHLTLFGNRRVAELILAGAPEFFE